MQIAIEFMPTPGLLKPTEARQRVIDALSDRFAITKSSTLGLTVTLESTTSVQTEVRRIAHKQGFQPSADYRPPVWSASSQQQSSSFRFFDT